MLWRKALGCAKELVVPAKLHNMHEGTLSLPFMRGEDVTPAKREILLAGLVLMI